MTPTAHTSYAPCTTKVSVEAPARLHLGFLDLNGALGRRFGSIGLTIDGVSTRLSATPAPTVVARAPDDRTADRARHCAQRVLGELKVKGGVRLDIESSIPAHAGLGSGTQLSLAIGTAVSTLFDLGLDTVELARILTRGQRSGIGIGAFDSGGFLIDGGRGSSALPPPIIARAHFPDSWRVLLIFDRARDGLHGDRERRAFEGLPTFPEHQAAHLCRIALMQIMPALNETDFALFTQGVGELQQLIGDHFAAAQGGGVYTSPQVDEVAAWARTEGYVGVGQSSWGPTGFIFVDSLTRARILLARLRERFQHQNELDFRLVQGRNSGSRIAAPFTHPKTRTYESMHA